LQCPPRHVWIASFRVIGPKRPVLEDQAMTIFPT
jgi:hypothetical protein